MNSWLMAVAGPVLTVFLGGFLGEIRYTLTFLLYFEIISAYLLYQKLYLAEYDKKHFHMLRVCGFPKLYLKYQSLLYAALLMAAGCIVTFLGLSVPVGFHLPELVKYLGFAAIGLLTDLLAITFLYNHLNYFLAKSISLASTIAFSAALVKILFLI